MVEAVEVAVSVWIDEAELAMVRGKLAGGGPSRMRGAKRALFGA